MIWLRADFMVLVIVSNDRATLGSTSSWERSNVLMVKLTTYIVMLVIGGALLHGCASKCEGWHSAAKEPDGRTGLHSELAQSQAIKRAEEFIAANGYTDLPPMEDKAKLSYESLEGQGHPDEVLKYRQNQLEHRAYGVIVGRKGQPGWTIVFRFAKGDSVYSHTIPDFDRYVEEYGRWVTMDPNGDDIRVEHEDIPLKEVEHRLVG